MIEKLKGICKVALERSSNPPQAFDLRLEQLYKELPEYLPEAIDFLMTDPKHDLSATDVIAQICLVSSLFKRCGVDVKKAGNGKEETSCLPSNILHKLPFLGLNIGKLRLTIPIEARIK